MKKIIIIIFLLIPINTLAITKEKVIFYKCVDGDTARFIVNKEEVKIRFLGIDSPEIAKQNTPAEEYGEEAARYTCRRLKNADKVEIEYENSSEKTDKYGRTLAYVFVDGKLIEEGIVKNGYANVKYIKKDYKYYDQLIKAEEYAIKNKKGIYNEGYQTDEDIEEKITKLFKKYLTSAIEKSLSSIIICLFLSIIATADSLVPLPPNDIPINVNFVSLSFIISIHICHLLHKEEPILFQKQEVRFHSK